MEQLRPWLVSAVSAFDPRRGRGRIGLAALTVALIATTITLLVNDGGHPAPAAARIHLPDISISDAPASTTPSHGSPRPAFRCSVHHGPAAGGSAPARICLPGIRVDASVMSLGLNPDRTVEVPPLSQVRDAGWYKFSAAPGAVGPTVVLGHVNSAQYGDGVFVHLNRLHAGDRVVVTRGDGRVATYRIDRLQQVSKSSFPSQEVYGATSGPALRLVTCGGRYDASTGSYDDNIIAFGTLLTFRR